MHVQIDGFRAHADCISPDVLENLVASHDRPDVAHQIFEQFEFFWSELYRTIAAVYFVSRSIEHQVTNP